MHTPHTPAIATAPLVLAADIGGTHARIGLLRAPVDEPRTAVLGWRCYTCAEWPSLDDILDDFLAHHAAQRRHIGRCALAIAGYVRNDEVVAENLRWPIRIAALKARLQLDRLDIVNDFEALACATHTLPHAAGITVVEAPGAPGPIAVIGPGTGLGCAVLIPSGGGTIVLPSEAGHAALAPGNARESAVLEFLGHDLAYVHAGHVLSGPGLVNLYRALAALDGKPAPLVEPAQISGAALTGNDPLAREALSTFCAWLGGFAGDLAVIFKANAGVYLAGGILPAISDFLVASDFKARFRNKGVMRDFVSGVPVRLIKHGQLAVRGAALMTSSRGRRDEA